MFGFGKKEKSLDELIRDYAKSEGKRVRTYSEDINPLDDSTQPVTVWFTDGSTINLIVNVESQSVEECYL